MQVDIVGWDIGGAHLKAVALDREGRISGIQQRPCPLWLGLDRLESAVRDIGREWPLAGVRTHALTMTGELADSFPDRSAGVRALLDCALNLFESPSQVFAGSATLLDASAVRDHELPLIASANWMASALWLAQRCHEGILIDVGSTTTDVIPLSDGAVRTRGYTDHERLRYDELVYVGIVRTPLMAIASKAPFDGGWVGLMNEHFATSADVFRLCGELPEHVDQWPAADQGAKDPVGSARRLARMIGCDVHAAPQAVWSQLAAFFRGAFIDRIAEAVVNQPLLQDSSPVAPLIGAGTGRFLVKAVAQRLNRPYRDLDRVVPATPAGTGFSVSDCLPAAAVAYLARQQR